MNERLLRLLNRMAMTPDIIIASILLATVAMMVLPVPTLLIDAVIGFNFGTAVLLLMIAVYLKDPVEFSAFPGVILISTVFRLSIAISTTRLILTEGDAGAMVRTFGEFVIAGNVVVGLVVFLIITIVQFIVVSKGAERVAEVGARFTLDALPGKQMSIDAEMRNGDIDQAEARRRRARLERESQLYGAMDGSMKFVKGDAIAGLIIIVINLVGGISIGVMQRGMPLAEAVREYSLLTVGDALISQIPALFLCITAATIVTRVSSENQTNLGRDIASQIASDRTALRLAAAALFGMSIVPGFPAPVLLALVGLFLGASFIKRPAKDTKAGKPAEAAAGEGGASAPRKAANKEAGEAAPVALRVSNDVLEALGAEAIEASIAQAHAGVGTDLGIQIPPVALGKVLEGETQAYRVEFEGVPTAEGELRTGRLVLADDPVHLDLAAVPSERVAGRRGGPDSVWFEETHRGDLEQAGIRFEDAATFLGGRVRAVLRKNAASFVGIQETKTLLTRMEASFGELVREVTRLAPIQKIADVLRRLLEEEVSIQNRRQILEALVEWAEKEHNPVLLTEYVRSHLKRQICFQYADAQRIISAVVLEREVEDLVRAGLRETVVGTYLVLDEHSQAGLLDQLRDLAQPPTPSAARAVVLCSVDVRRHMRNLLVRNGLDVPVLSYQELSPEFVVQPMRSVARSAAGDAREPMLAA